LSEAVFEKRDGKKVNRKMRDTTVAGVGFDYFDTYNTEVDVI
jgi:hypothetical protein